jgi:hypothetical protein
VKPKPEKSGFVNSSIRRERVPPMLVIPFHVLSVLERLV